MKLLASLTFAYSISLINPQTISSTNPSGPSQPPSMSCGPDPNSSTSLTMAEIKYLSQELSSDIKNKGPCWKLFKDRIISSIQISEDFIVDGPKLLNFNEKIERDELLAEDFSFRVKNSFRNSFSDCDDLKCVLNNFCDNVFSNDLIRNGSSQSSDSNDLLSDSITAQLKQICKQESWRFQDFIQTRNLENVCDFDFVPVRYEHRDANWCESYI